jgi:hypothetical protein
MTAPLRSGIFRPLAGALVASLLLGACGGSSKSGPNAPTGAATSLPATATSVASARDECTADDAPPNLHSTTHRVEVATTTQTIEMKWDIPARPVRSYRYAFSQNPEVPPNEMELLDGGVTGVSSGPLGQNRWYFYLVERLDSGEGSLVRCGPYVIARGTPSASGESGGGADTVSLTISVVGGSSVEYFTNQNQRLFCGDVTVSLHDVTCTAEFVRGSEARIQRTLSLPVEEEARWRLAGWEGACASIDTDTEPRGGQCNLIMNEDKTVFVQFTRRATITITHTGPPQLLNRWGIDYAPVAQKGGGNPLTLHGNFDCDTDMLAECKKTGYFDTGTTITLRAGTGMNAGSFQSFSGACSTTESTCEFRLDSDAEATYAWEY